MPAVQDVRGSLLAAYGRADGTIDTRRAAREIQVEHVDKATGEVSMRSVSQRTIQRWAKGESRPRIAAQESLREKVRETAVSGKRRSRLANRGASVQLTAVIEISGDKRRRSIGSGSAIKLSGQDMDRINEAYAKGGDKAAEAVLAHAITRSSYMREITTQSKGRVTHMPISDISEVAFQG